MAKAIVPNEFPAVPEDMTGWRRSTRGRGGMYHLHLMGETACGSTALDRHASQSARHLGDIQYWGVCPRCLRISQEAPRG